MLDAPRHSALALAALLTLIARALAPAHAQSISTNSQVPPLQWINLTPLTSGPAPAPLKDASIGYDDTHRNLIIFGGEGQQGFPQSQTYLLNLDSLVWTTPNSPDGLKSSPPPRSAAISGQDIAASYRNGHIIVGGKGTDGKALSDVWEFDYTNQFWSQVSVSGSSSPSPRWGAAGGNDLRVQSGLENTLFITGGFTDDSTETLSDVWKLTVSGTLSSNLPNDTKATWESVTLQNKTLPLIGGSASSVVFQGSQEHIIAVGGCGASSSSCANGRSYVINVDSAASTSPNGCPAPRTGAALAPNLNSASASFDQQVFLLLGTFNSSEWQDDGGLDKGEVGVFQFNTGTWARIIPAGDPSSSTQVPSPREGPAVFSWTSALVGTTRPAAADTVVFGGRDAAGNYLSELWILRAYNGTVTSSNEHWSGYGNGQLSGGQNADGTGVTVQYLPRCAVQIGPSTPTETSSTGSPTSSSPSSPTSSGDPGDSRSSTFHPYDTSVVHKSLAPISAALIFPAAVFHRLSQPSVASPGHDNTQIGFFYLASVTGLVAFALGIGGIATAFSSLHLTASSLAKRSISSHLETAHGQAGIALFVGLYGVVPALMIAALYIRWRNSDSPLPTRRRRANSNDIHEKMELYHSRTVESPTPEPPLSTLSPYTAGPLPATRASSESAMDDRSSPSTRSFEVVNRPTRIRRASAHSLAAFADPRPSISPRNLSDMSWLQRRRSLTTVGDLDYANVQYNRRQAAPSTPGTTAIDMMSTNELMDGMPQLDQPTMPGTLTCVIHILLHIFLLALSILALIALFQRAPIAAFAVFVAWTVCFYAIIFTMAWRGIPSESILTVLFSRIRAPPPLPPPPPPGVGQQGVPFPNGGGPYQHHQPPYRAAHDSDYPTSISHAGHTMEGDDDDDDDMDDDTRQRRIEEEMARRDVSIVTVPRRRLLVVNGHADPVDGPSRHPTSAQSHAHAP